MSLSSPAPVRWWLSESPEPGVKDTINRMSRFCDVVRIAVLPDVHVAGDICVGTAMATRRLIYPAAVGGDIGCGMLAIGFDSDASPLRRGEIAGQLLRELCRHIPAGRRNRRFASELGPDLCVSTLSTRSLAAAIADDATLQCGTVGGGNHFVEFQSDEEDRLWLMIHTGSRAVGQAVRNHHVSGANRENGVATLDADLHAGQAYLNDAAWASRYARANRRRISADVIAILDRILGIHPIDSSEIECDHNHVRKENHDGMELFVHRKGAMCSEAGLAGVLPGSMGTLSYHVEGRGNAESLCSSAHGAGRRMSRARARESFATSDLKHQLRDVWFDPRQTAALIEEAPHAYKDVRAVLRAQEDLARVTRTLRPVLIFKGG